MASPVTPATLQRWAGAPTGPVCAVWPSEAPQLQFSAHGASGGAVVLHRVQVCMRLLSLSQN